MVSAKCTALLSLEEATEKCSNLKFKIRKYYRKNAIYTENRDSTVIH